LIEGEQPAYALCNKRQASISLAIKQVKAGQAQAAISMGPTGGVLAAALTHLGTLEGISRPVIGGPFLGFFPDMIALDLGMNIDCRPDQLLDFAIVGTIYARKIMGIEEPGVGLLSIGKEEGKGNELVKATFPLLKASHLKFIGNIEGNDIASGVDNVVICEGFTGNVMAKFCEGLGTTISHWLQDELKGKLSEADLTSLTQRLIARTVPADSNGGGPLCAINGLVRSRPFPSP
jgi:phosphate acyltransferase